MKILTFAASTRKDSLNRKLITVASSILRTMKDVEVDAAEFKDFEMPLYDGDLEAATGVPSGARSLADRIKAADAIVISTPEYNGGIPGTLKNALDWVSRTTPIPVSGKPLLLLGASPGALGAVRGLWHTRVPFEAIGTLVHPEMFGLPRANQAFDESGNLIDEKNHERLSKLISTFVLHARAIRNSHD